MDWERHGIPEAGRSVKEPRTRTWGAFGAQGSGGKRRKGIRAWTGPCVPREGLRCETRPLPRDRTVLAGTQKVNEDAATGKS